MTRLKKIEPIDKLSRRQMECLTFIAWYLEKTRSCPTQKEIAQALGLKSNSAWSYTEPLKKKKFLTIALDTGRRNLRLTDRAYDLLKPDDLLVWEADSKTFFIPEEEL